MPGAAASSEPSVGFSHLYGADGSATFSQNGYTIIGSVNGPIEITRRDELPEEAAVDVVVRPAVGIGGKIPQISHLICPTQFTHSRYKGAPSRVNYTTHSSPIDSDSKLSSNTDTGHTSDYKDTGKPDKRSKAISSFFGNTAIFTKCPLSN